VRDLVREQPHPRVVARPVLALAEHDVLPGRERPRVDPLGLRGRGVTAVHANAREIAPERLLELRARRVGQALAGAELLDERTLARAGPRRDGGRGPRRAAALAVVVLARPHRHGAAPGPSWSCARRGRRGSA
jgi:hypothetical protein